MTRTAAAAFRRRCGRKGLVRPRFRALRRRPARILVRLFCRKPAAPLRSLARDGRARLGILDGVPTAGGGSCERAGGGRKVRNGERKFCFVAVTDVRQE